MKQKHAIFRGFWKSERLRKNGRVRGKKEVHKREKAIGRLCLDVFIRPWQKLTKTKVTVVMLLGSLEYHWLNKCERF